MPRVALTAGLFLLLLFVRPAPGQPSAAVVRLASHGGSATVIQTTHGRSILLSCAHCFEGADRTKKLTLDLPSPAPGPPQRILVNLLAVDYRADLSLIAVSTGPLPYVAPVSPTGAAGVSVVSVGYDRMKLPPTVARVTIVSQGQHMTYTRERPIPGRSGGGLFDWEQGVLVGVCHGFEVLPNGRGMYVGSRAINTFLARHATYLIPPAQQVSPRRVAPGPLPLAPPVPQAPQWPSPYGAPEQGLPYCPDGNCPLPPGLAPGRR